MNPQYSREFLRNLPKVELHRHLECSMRLSTLTELATDLGMDVPQTDSGLHNQFLVLEPMRDLESVLQKFLRTQKVLESEEILARITYEAIEDAVNDGIKILELRFAPTFITDGHPNLNFEKVLRGIRKGVEHAKELPIAVGFISIIQRILSTEIAERVLDFTLENKDFFMALDLADNEQGFDPLNFAKIFSRARENGLGITVHAGEADFPGSAINVKNSIEVLGAQRIGHGLQIYKDPDVMTLLKRKGIPLELCLTSNWLTQATESLETHPVRKLMEAGVPVTLNTDDPGIFGIDLTHEYGLWHRIHEFTKDEFDLCNDLAAASSFIPLIKKQKYWPRPIHKLR
jgi:adenosine deaminase